MSLGTQVLHSSMKTTLTNMAQRKAAENLTRQDPRREDWSLRKPFRANIPFQISSKS